jgi:dephospho-CoA kinase
MIIGITGRIAAGKETLTDSLRKKGFIYLETFTVLAEELEKRGLEITRANMQDLGDEIREKYGVFGVMKMLLEKTEPGKDYIFDSLRNPGEAEFLRENIKDFVLIGVDAPQKLRFERILKRGKPSDPKTWEEFLKIDNRDFFDETNPMGQRVGKCMEIADFKINNDVDLEKSMKEIEEVWEKIKKRCDDKNNYKGVVIEESLEDNSILKDIKIIKTKVEKVTPKHKTPWISKWTLHSIEVPEKQAEEIADRISKVLDSKHNWYADFKNNKLHFIIFKNKVFCVDIHSKEQYDKAKEYGISLGIPEYQVDFHPEIKVWER